ncbi:MAG: Uma2 family endonuclease [Planctomycetota bacterium]|nr:Uma2 family endonuclease [Planctomycetota bacterium]
MGTLPLELAKREGRKPTWGMALLYPDQGGWTLEDYLGLDVGRHVEFDRGFLEFLPMPDNEHQDIVFQFTSALKAYARGHGGRAAHAPFPMRLWGEKFREPDALFMRQENLSRCKGRFWEQADLVVEVVSSSNKTLDLKTKRAEYARAGIPEYWIVDPARGSITVLTLPKRRKAYVVHGEFKKGKTASSALLKGFEVDVSAALEAR